MPETGTVKFFNAEKGVGFITPDNGGPDLMVHYTNIASESDKRLNENQRVEYEIVPSPKGLMAVSVRRL
jgi:CspA family cold shock protein